MTFEVGELVYIDSFSDFTGLAEIISINGGIYFPYRVQILNHGKYHGTDIDCQRREVRKLTEAPSFDKLIKYVAK